MAKQKNPARMDKVFLFWGFIFGGVSGGLLTLLMAPKRSRNTQQQIVTLSQSVREKIEASIPADPIEDSMAAGKAAARRRRDELGLEVG